jgi:hypothetical protein
MGADISFVDKGSQRAKCRSREQRARSREQNIEQ